MNRILPWLLALSICSACSTTSTEATEAPPPDPYVGQWGMATQMSGNEISATMTLSYGEAGQFVGSWESQGQTMELRAIEATASAIAFERVIPGGQVLAYAGVIDGDEMTGHWSGPFGELPCNGTRGSINPFPDRHTRPIVEEDGATLLWASHDEEGGEDEWFDVSGSPIDPVTFQFGIGKDTIPSIDEPEFVVSTDERLAERGVDMETDVLGVALNGVARAYPVDVKSMHEVVNDHFAGDAFAVLW